MRMDDKNLLLAAYDLLGDIATSLQDINLPAVNALRVKALELEGAMEEAGIEDLISGQPVIEKPEGYDLRDKRSEKTDDPRLWTGQDALYDASLYLNSHPGEQVLVIWWEKLPQEKRRFSFRNSCTSTAEANNLILHALNFGIKGDL